MEPIARKQGLHVLFCLLLVYGAASLVHFTHNAEFLADYPNLPASWSPANVYLAWTAMTIVGVLGWLLISRGFFFTGLSVVIVYAALGLESLGHYVRSEERRVGKECRSWSSAY